ncbi:MAG: acyloxyacyl hydrolase [Acidobacteria bacterium]|nr:acyloxyacyl hydrolase [Acidobacteriota bacterium]
MRTNNLLGLLFGLLFFVTCSAGAGPPSPPPTRAAAQQHPAIYKGVTEWGWLSGGGVGIAGCVREGDFGALHLRWGRVLTADHGPAFLRGNLQYALEVVPAMVLFQSTTVFGGGLTPLLLQYNFTGGRRMVPFFQAGAGMLFTTEPVPTGTSRFNFTPQGGLGIYWFPWPRTALVFGVRYHHISNAGLAQPNPGRNSLFFHAGISWWR